MGGRGSVPILNLDLKRNCVFLLVLLGPSELALQEKNKHMGSSWTHVGQTVLDSLHTEEHKDKCLLLFATEFGAVVTE